MCFSFYQRKLAEFATPPPRHKNRRVEEGYLSASRHIRLLFDLSRPRGHDVRHLDPALKGHRDEHPKRWMVSGTAQTLACEPFTVELDPRTLEKEPTFRGS